MDEKSRKRHRPAWKDQPAFMDASASVSAATYGARRLPELKQLYLHSLSSTTTSQVVVLPQDIAFQSGGGQTSSRHLRRRVTSHNSRHRHRFPTEIGSREKTSTTRRAKRSNPSILAHGHYEWWKEQSLSNTSSSSPSSENKVQWIATHLWHVKRFHMETLWGWQVPVVHTNRGPRATLRLSHTHCLIQDITWERQPIFLEWKSESPIQEVVQCLAKILPSFEQDFTLLVRKLEKKISMTGECMLHEVDQFPRGAIGPIWWHVEEHVLRIMGHPSIMQHVRQTILSLKSNQPSIFQETSNSKDGMERIHSVFRMCGVGVMDVLTSILGFQSQHGGTDEVSWQQLVKEPPTLETLSHGTMMRATMNLPGHDTSVSIRLVRIKPRRLDCTVNRVVAGWELYCPPSHATVIWNELSMKCVVIGMVDQCHLQLECEPPLPLFPRDYIDCKDSSKYWFPSSSQPDSSKEHNSWSRTRQFYEGGWGRLPLLQHSPNVRGIQWSTLMTPFVMNDDDNDEKFEEGIDEVDVVTVRGQYGEPFVSILDGCGKKIESPHEEGVTKTRRNRRRAIPANTIKKVQPADQGHVGMWHQTVRNLLTSLSLPAVLQCHVVVVDKGTLQCRDRLFVGNFCLGFVTAGSFSPARGCCHGFGILGASRLLQELSETEFPDTVGRFSRLLSGEIQLCLAGKVVSSSVADGIHDVVLSLVLC